MSRVVVVRITLENATPSSVERVSDFLREALDPLTDDPNVVGLIIGVSPVVLDDP